MPAADHRIRYLAANVREALAGHYMNFGTEFGYGLARRITIEMISHVKEVHGERAAYEMITGIGDRLLKGSLYGEVDDGEMRGIVEALAREATAADVLLPPDEETPDGTWMLEFRANTINVVVHDGPAPADQLPRVRGYLRFLEAEVAKGDGRLLKVAAWLVRRQWWEWLIVGALFGWAAAK